MHFGYGCNIDGTPINRRLVRLHNSQKQLEHRVPTPLAMDGRDFFVHLGLTAPDENKKFLGTLGMFNFVDVLLNSQRISIPAIYRRKDGREISWNHLMEHHRRNRSETVLVLLPRLKF